VCPRCTGIGSIRSVESMTLAILRLIGEEARKDKTAQIIAQVPGGSSDLPDQRESANGCARSRTRAASSC
jgi:Ribonuclease G/E